MCGIFTLLNNSSSKYDPDLIHDSFIKGEARGPEQSILINTNDIWFGFHRLAINGYNNINSEQPIRKHNCLIVCNGEIYNWKHLHTLSNTECTTGSDCEIILELYNKYGIEQTLSLIDGVFSFIIYDITQHKLVIARDPFGIRPLFIWSNNVDIFLFASELKMGHNIIKDTKDVYPEQFKPGHYMTINTLNSSDNHTTKYSIMTYSKSNTINTEQDACNMIKASLIAAVTKRVNNTDRDIACLLSGGLDSSLVCAIIAKIYNNLYGKDGSKRLHTWSIGLNGSEDLKYARMVADYINTTHHEIICSEAEFLNTIDEVIYRIESNDTTTVRASVGNYLICKYIRTHSNAKVIFNGDGSDELTGGYLYFHYANDSVEFDKECKRLLQNIHLFDVLRSDRSISSNGLEARTPFLDIGFVQSYLSIPSHLRNHNNNKHIEKYLLRKSFTDNYLPQDVLWRRKEAFSDGVSNETMSWFEVIQNYTHAMFPDMSKKESEQKYYDMIFNKYYGSSIHNKKVMPFKWMPRFINATDSSARTLSVYKQ
jgi:asparagine synthase (glutamine-hydrolysing)